MEQKKYKSQTQIADEYSDHDITKLKNAYSKGRFKASEKLLKAKKTSNLKNKSDGESFIQI